MPQPIPLHPMLVHFPIAFFVLELILLCLWRLKREESYRGFALLVFRMGYLFLIPVALAGLVDAGGLEGLKSGVLTHFRAAAVLFGFYTLRALYWKWGKMETSAYAKIQIAGALVGNFLVGLTGYLGGLLVYG